ncbi:hypothetical protein LXL04_034463 [Taraxacum kok-saghyz]
MAYYPNTGEIIFNIQTEKRSYIQAKSSLIPIAKSSLMVLQRIRNCKYLNSQLIVLVDEDFVVPKPGKMGFRFLILNPVVTKTGALVMPMPSKCFDSAIYFSNPKAHSRPHVLTILKVFI